MAASPLSGALRCQLLQEQPAVGRERAEGVLEADLGGRLVVGDAEEAREFGFEMAQGTVAGGVGGDVIQGPPEEIEQGGFRVFRFDREFQQLTEVGA